MKPVPDLIRGMQSPSEQLEDGFPLFSASGNGDGLPLECCYPENRGKRTGKRRLFAK